LSKSTGLADALAIIDAAENGTRAKQPLPINVSKLRRRMGMTQERFAARLGFSVATLRHWERGDRKPKGPALVLLNVIALDPRAVLRALTIVA
jgi:putative transcriptional regulator